MVGINDTAKNITVSDFILISDDFPRRVYSKGNDQSKGKGIELLLKQTMRAPDFPQDWGSSLGSSLAPAYSPFYDGFRL